MAEYIYDGGFKLPGWSGWSPIKSLGAEDLSINLGARMVTKEELGLSPIKDTDDTEDIDDTEDKKDEVDQREGEPTPIESLGQQVVGQAAALITKNILDPDKAPPPSFTNPAKGLSSIKFG